MVGAGHPTANLHDLPLGEALAAVGHGDDVSFRQRSAAALDAVGPDMAANIEHQDAALGKIEGLRGRYPAPGTGDRRARLI